MDTGWFHHSNTRAGTLRAVAELLDAGARINQIYRKLFEQNTMGRLKLMGETLRGLKTDLDGRVAYATITKDDLMRTGAIPQDSEDLVDFTVSMRGVELGLLFIEQLRGGAKVSIRTRSGVDCAKLAAQFGGGGHKEAAGATIERNDERSASSACWRRCGRRLVWEREVYGSSDVGLIVFRNEPFGENIEGLSACNHAIPLRISQFNRRRPVDTIRGSRPKV